MPKIRKENILNINNNQFNIFLLELKKKIMAETGEYESLNKLAYKFGISSNYLSQLKSGKRKKTISTKLLEVINSIGDKYGIKVNFIQKV